MKKYFHYKNIIILVLLILLGLAIVNPKGVLPNRVEQTVRIDSIPYAVHDSIPYEVEVQVDVPYEVEVPVEVKVPVIQQVDTAAILKTFYAKNYSKEVFTLPNNMGTVTIMDTISQNMVMNRKIDPKIKKFVRDTVRVPEKKVGQLYFGVNAQFDKPNFVNGIGVSTLYRTKDDKIFKLGIGVNNRMLDQSMGKLGPYVDAGVYWKIKIRR